MKILNIVENLNKGAVETWLVKLFIESTKHKPEWEWTFYCILPEIGIQDPVVKEHGGRIIYTPVELSDKKGFLKSLRTTLKEGDYDVVHAHHDYMSGFYLLAGLGLGYRNKTVLHLHNMERGLPTNKRLIRPFLLEIFRQCALFLSKEVLGNSKATVKDFVRRYPIKSEALYCGVNFKTMHVLDDTRTFKEALGLNPNDKVLLFVGRLYKNKNPTYCLDILTEIHKTNSNYVMVYVGEGEDKLGLIDKAKSLNLEQKVHFLGWRQDVMEIMQVSDLHLFPRLEKPLEGFGINVAEAQAAGLPSLISYGVPDDVVCIEDMVTYLSIKEPVDIWAKQCLNIVENPNKRTRQQCHTMMLDSKIDMSFSVSHLQQVYTKYDRLISTS